MIKVEFRAKSFTDSKPLLTQQEIKYYKDTIRLVSEKLSVGLDLSHLESIVIPENYKEELFEFQEQNGIGIGYTETDMGVGHAMALTYNKNGEEKSTIFINKVIAIAFVEDEFLNSLEEEARNQFIDGRRVAINLIHHELAHVHESSVLKRAFKNEKTGIPADSLTHDLRVLAQMVWSEYYACRLSSGTCSDIAREIDNLLKQAIWAKEKADEKIEEYRYHGDIDKLVSEIYTWIGYT